MSDPVDILAFSPHPDDAELGCAGSLMLASDRGLKTAIADLSAGELSSRGTPQQRMGELNTASELLGLNDRVSLNLPDTELGTDPSHGLAIIEVIRETRPRVVLAPYWEDRHPDHAAAGRLVKEAFFFSGIGKVGKRAPHKPERLYFYMLHQPFTPSFVVDISKVWQRKLEVLNAYLSQFRGDDTIPETALSQSGFLELMEARARWFGAMIGKEYGEPFFCPGPVPLGELPLNDDRDKDGAPFHSYCMFT